MSRGLKARARPCVACLLAVTMTTCACVSTEPERAGPSPWVCAEQLSTTDAPASVVLVRGRFGSVGSRICSGVVIAPRLVVTSLRCVVANSDPSSSDPWLDASPGSAGIMGGLFDYEQAACLREPAWAPIEDGTFETALGRVLQPEAVVVEVPGAAASDAGGGVRPRINFLVDDVITSRASSSCQESLAIIVLQAPLDVRPVPIRIDEGTQPGEPIELVGYCVTEADLAAEAFGATVDAVTTDTSTQRAPPHALTAAGVLSMFSAGGGVFSADTGALVAVIASGGLPQCGRTEGTTMAFRAAGFRELITTVARQTEQTLRLERRASSAGTALPECADR